MYKKGFTLIELLVVVMMVAVLTSIAMPQYRRSMDRAKAAEAMQMLPALFEARERWIIEHNCMWTGAGGLDSVVCADEDEILEFPKLDIESSAVKSVSEDKQSFSTANFTYYIRTEEKPLVGNQRCVKAVPRWGDSRGLTSATIYYHGGNKFACNDGASNQSPCARLNVDDGTGAGACYDLR